MTLYTRYIGDLINFKGMAVASSPAPFPASVSCWLCDYQREVPWDSDLTFPAVLNNESSLSVLPKLTVHAVTNNQVKLLATPGIDVHCIVFDGCWKSAPSKRFNEPPVILLNDSTNQPERANHSVVPLSSPNQLREGSVLSKSMAICDWTCFQPSWSLNHSFVHPRPNWPSYWR